MFDSASGRHHIVSAAMHSGVRLSRRGVVLGATALGGCAVFGSAPAASSLVGPAAYEHWTVPFVGGPPNRVLVMRHAGSLRRKTLEGFFDDWDFDELGIYDLVAACAQTELYWHESLADVIVVMRGVPAGPIESIVGKNGGPTHLLGTSAAGVTTWDDVHGWHLFRLPDGTLLLSVAAPAERLARRLATDGRTPPLPTLEPGALIVQQDKSGWGIRDMLAGDSVLVTTTATFGAPPGADVPALVRCEFPTSSQAAAAADDLDARYIRVRPSPKDRWQYHPVGYFMATLREARAEGASLVLRGSLTYESVAAYVRG
jgi:hypothetical protein